MLLNGQASVAVCGPDIGLHKQCGKVDFFSDSCSPLGEEAGLAAPAN